MVMPLRTIVLPYPAVHDGWNHLTYAQEEKGLIFPIMTKGLQDNGVGVNAQWIPEGVVLLPTLKQTSSYPFGMRRQVRVRLTRTHR